LVPWKRDAVTDVYADR